MSDGFLHRNIQKFRIFPPINSSKKIRIFFPMEYSVGNSNGIPILTEFSVENFKKNLILNFKIRLSSGQKGLVGRWNPTIPLEIPTEMWSV